MVDLGINSAGVSYEVALEVLGQKRQPIMHAMYGERAKPNPSAAYVGFCKNLLSAIDNLQMNLQPADAELINTIMNSKDFPL